MPMVISKGKATGDTAPSVPKDELSPSKVCKACGVAKPLDEFAGCGFTVDRKQTMCRPCMGAAKSEGMRRAKEKCHAPSVPPPAAAAITLEEWRAMFYLLATGITQVIEIVTRAHAGDAHRREMETKKHWRAFDMVFSLLPPRPEE